MNTRFFFKTEIDACLPGGLKIRPTNLAALDISSVGGVPQRGPTRRLSWGALELSETLWGPPPPSLCVGNRLHSASLTFPEFQGRSKQLLIGEGRGHRNMGGAVKKQ